MSDSLFVTRRGEELTEQEMIVKLMQRVTNLEEQVELSTKVLREVLNQLQND